MLKGSMLNMDGGPAGGALLNAAEGPERPDKVTQGEDPTVAPLLSRGEFPSWSSCMNNGMSEGESMGGDGMRLLPGLIAEDHPVISGELEGSWPGRGRGEVSMGVASGASCGVASGSLDGESSASWLVELDC